MRQPSVNITLRHEANASTVTDFLRRIEALETALDAAPCHNVPAGIPNGALPVRNAIADLRALVAAIIRHDLNTGREFVAASQYEL